MGCAFHLGLVGLRLKHAMRCFLSQGLDAGFVRCWRMLPVVPVSTMPCPLGCQGRRRRSRDVPPLAGAALTSPSPCPHLALSACSDNFELAALYLASDASPDPQTGCKGKGGLAKADIDASGLPVDQLECAWQTSASE